MALLWFDGCDNVDSSAWAYSGQQYEFTDGASWWNCQTSYGGFTPRHGIGKFYGGTNDSPRIFSADFGNKDEVIVGFAFGFNNAFPNTQAHFAVCDGGAYQVELRFTTSREINVTRNGTQIGITATNVWNTATWHYLQVRIKIHNSAGTVEIRLDGTTVLTLTGVDTQATANAYVNRIQFRCPGNASIMVIDDIYVIDLTGSFNNTWLGEVRVRQGYAGADGDVNDFTPSAGNRWACVDEVAPSDADYVYSGTVGHKQLFSLAALTVPGPIAGAKLNYRAYKNDAGKRTLKGLWKFSGVEYRDSEKALRAGGSYFTALRETHPASGLQWALSDFENGQFGVELAG